MIDAGKFYEVQKYCAITNHVWDGYWICANPASWNRLPNDYQDGRRARRSTRLRCSSAPTSRSSTATCRRISRRRGSPSPGPTSAAFRDKLRAAGFYEEWRGKIGAEAWALLEKHVGKLA